MSPYLKMRLANKGKGQFRAEADTIWLYDVIAADDDEAQWWGGISPRQFIAALADTTGPVTLRINSPGGSVFGAQAMVAAMRAHPQPITARIDSLAASAASVIAAEAARTEIVTGAKIMIHKAWGLAIGNETDMRATADLLAKIDRDLAATYARRSNADEAGLAVWLDRMAAETWYDAEEAVAAGLADSVISDSLQRPSARWDLSAFVAAPVTPVPQDVDPENDPPAASAAGPTDRMRRLAALLVKGI